MKFVMTWNQFCFVHDVQENMFLFFPKTKMKQTNKKKLSNCILWSLLSLHRPQ